MLLATVTLTLILLWENANPLIVKTSSVTVTWSWVIVAIKPLLYCTWYLSWSNAIKLQSSILRELVLTTKVPFASVDSPVTWSERINCAPVKSISAICFLGSGKYKPVASSLLNCCSPIKIGPSYWEPGSDPVNKLGLVVNAANLILPPSFAT